LRTVIATVILRHPQTSSALEDQTELIALGISHRPPAVTVLVEVRVRPTPPASEVDYP